MSDLLIRNLSEAEMRRLERRARTMGLSRSEYVRRRLRQDIGAVKLTRAELEQFAHAHADLADPSVMADAWR